jgi:hypothetical protein
MASTYLSRTTGSPTNSYKCTFSAWIKKGSVGNSRQELITEYTDANNRTYIGFNSSDKLEVGSVQSSSWVIDFGYSRVFRDTSAWYNIVLAFDTTQATASDRVKLYVNGVQETAIPGSPTYPSQNSSIALNSASKSITIGASRYGGVSGAFNGSMSHIHFIDGTAYDASYFGSTDSTTGEWTINTSPSVTYGTNGFFILKDGNSVTDQSGNSNNWTVGGGTLTNTEDCPDNVFATMNPLTKGGTSSVSLDRGNNQINFDASGQWYAVYSTLGAITGKYYAEVLTDAIGGETSVGIINSDTASLNQATQDYLGKETDSIGYLNDGRIFKANAQLQTGLTALSSTSIVGIAMDLDNNSVQFYVNGTSTGNAVSLTANKIYLFGTSGYSGARHRWNFGNGYFGTTAVSSAGTNASGNGIFEYDCPDGYTALSTKGLNL